MAREIKALKDGGHEGGMVVNDPAMLLFYVGSDARVRDWIEHG